MKNEAFPRRLRNALRGVFVTVKSERSFQTQIFAALLALAFLGTYRAPLVWWALFLLAIGGVLGFELVNTALERLIDHLHPGHHSAIGLAKDCAAGAVLVFSLVAVGIFAAFVLTLN